MSLKELIEGQVQGQEKQEKKVILFTKEKQMTQEKEKHEKQLETLFSKYENQIGVKTLYKLYMLQNYSFDMKYFKGTKYNKATLLKYKTIIKDYCLSESKEKYLTGSSPIKSFLDDLIKLATPFPIIDTFKRTKVGVYEIVNVKELLKSKLLTHEEAEFIKSPIEEGKLLKALQKAKKLIKSTKKKRDVASRTFSDYMHQIVKENYNKSIPELLKLIPGAKIKTLTSLKTQYTAIAENRDLPWMMDKVKRIWNESATSNIQKESKAMSNPITGTRYAAVNEDGVIATTFKTSHSLDYVKGFVSGHNSLSEDKLSLAKIKIELI